jgi:hypothetical protein
MNLHQEQTAEPVPQSQQQCLDATDLRGLPCERKRRPQAVQAHMLMPLLVVVPPLPPNVSLSSMGFSNSLCCMASCHGINQSEYEQGFYLLDDDSRAVVWTIFIEKSGTMTNTCGSRRAQHGTAE